MVEIYIALFIVSLLYRLYNWFRLFSLVVEHMIWNPDWNSQWDMLLVSSTVPLYTVKP